MEEQFLEFLNTATRDELIALRGLGPSLADRVMASRPFASLEDCARQVRGLSMESLHKMADGFLAETADADEAPNTPSADDLSIPDEAQPAAAAAADETSLNDDEWKQRLEAMKAQFESQMEAQAQQARERMEALSAEWQRKSSRRVTLATLLWSDVIVMALMLVMMVALMSISGAKIQRDVQTRLDVAVQQIETVQTDLDTLQNRVDALEGIGERTAELEDAQQALAESVDTMQADLEAMQSDLEAFSQRLDETEARGQRFDDFLQGLQALLNQALAQPLGGTQ